MTPAELRAWRLDHHLTQQELAELLGMGKRQILSYERASALIPKSVELALGWLNMGHRSFSWPVKAA